MCEGCWENYGSPKIYNDKIKRAVSLIREVYKFNSAGGNLHVILDDWNLSDYHVNDIFYDNQIKEHKESEGQYKAERECLDYFRVLTLEERASVLAIDDGYFNP